MKTACKGLLEIHSPKMNAQIWLQIIVPAIKLNLNANLINVFSKNTSTSPTKIKQPSQFNIKISK